MEKRNHALRDSVLLTLGITLFAIGMTMLGVGYGIPYLERQQDKRSVERQFEREIHYQKLMHEHYLNNKKGCKDGS